MTALECFRNETTLPVSWSGVSPSFCGVFSSSMESIDQQ